MSYTPFSSTATTQREHLLFVGMDVHKDTHAAVGTTVYGERLAKHLFLNNVLVKTVSPIFVDRERKYETHPEKNDYCIFVKR